MQFTIALVVLAVCATSVAAFRAMPTSTRTFSQMVSTKRTVAYLSDKPTPSVEMVPVDKVTTSNAATATGGILGFVLGGPALAAILAAITNYVSKKDDDSGEALRGVGKTVVESYNFLNKINAKYGITSKLGSAVDSAVSSVESEDAKEVVGKVKSTFSSASTTLGDLNKEYDLVTKGKEILGAAGDLSDAAIAKLVELNQKYDFVESTKKAATSAIDEAKKATSEASSPSTTTKKETGVKVEAKSSSE